MPPVFCYKGARRAVLAVGKDNRQERKLRPRAEKRDSAFPRERIKPQLSISVISQGKDFHALILCCMEITCSCVLAPFEGEGGNAISFPD